MEVPIHDMQGKELGKLVLTDEVDQVLKTTGVALLVNYDPALEKTIGYLH